VASGQRLLKRIEPVPADYLDIGAGTGSLALAAAARWSGSRIVGLDASAGMLSVARQQVATERRGDDDRFRWVAADAADMPLADASFDAVTSAFMLQLVDDRAAVLREVWRVLKPGGTFALVSWLDRDLEMPADAAFDDVVHELGLEHPRDDPTDPHAAEFRDVAEARDELLAAGFEHVDAGPDEVHYRWSRDGYLDFKMNYDEFELVDSLRERDRTRLRDGIRARWAALPDAAFSLRGSTVWATARRA
jgi:ubiquinone/menaquinone biosynthesis C-methylase UbiE